MPVKSSSSIMLHLFVIGELLLFLLASCSTRDISTQTSSPITNQSTKAIVETTQVVVSPPTEIPSLTTETSPSCMETIGTVQDQTIPSDVLNEEIDVKIYLPPCYSSDLDRQYPVLYMLHGQDDMNDQWLRIGLASTMNDLLAQKMVRPFIVVLPNESKSNMEAFSSKYGEALVEDLIPVIDEEFRVCTERNCRAIGGLSRGGNWAIHLGFTYPELFITVGAHSAPLFYGEITNIYRVASNLETKKSLPSFYLDAGNRDPDRADVLLFLDTLQELNIRHEYNGFLGYHDEIYWSAHVRDYLLWYDSQFSEPSTE